MAYALGWALLGFTLAWAHSICRQLSRLWRRSELYEHDREAVLLNLNAGPGTRWMNMGWWYPENAEQSFPAAAELLARKLWTAAGLKKGERICEVGFGSGESVRLLAAEYAPARLVGVTSLPAQHRRAERLVAQTSLDLSRVHLLAGDATSALERFGPSSADVVLALDSAYHFNTRQSFFHSAHALIVPGGRLALTDLILPSRRLSWPESAAIRAVYLLAGIPLANLVTAKEYERQLVKVGFDDVRVEVISEHVWPGFCAFVGRRDAELGGVLHPAHWAALTRYTKVVRWYADLAGEGKRSKLEFVMVTARKPGAG